MDQKLRPFGNKIEPFYGYGTYCQSSNNRTEAFFVCRHLPPTNKKLFLCVLGGSAVKILFWTSMILDTDDSIDNLADIISNKIFLEFQGFLLRDEGRDLEFGN